MYIVLLNYISLLIFFTNCQLSPVSQDNEGRDQLVSLAINIFKNEEISSKNAIVIITAGSDEIAHKFYQESSKNEIKLAVTTFKLLENDSLVVDNKTRYFTDLTLIFFNKEKYESIEEIVFEIELLPIFGIRHRYLVVIEKKEDDRIEDNWVEEAFQSFWERQVLRVALCFWEDNNLKLYTYNPYNEQFAKDVTSNIEHNNFSVLYAKKIRNMNGYPLRLYDIDYVYKNTIVQSGISENGRQIFTGRDGFFFTILSDLMNSSIETHTISEDIPASWVHKANLDIPMGEFFDVLISLYDFDLVANIGGIFIGDDTMDYVFEYGRDDMYILTPKSPEIPRYLYIFLIIPVDIWIATFISLMVVAFTLVGIRKYNSKNIPASEAFLDIYRLLLNESIPERKKSGQEKIVLIVWIIYGIIFCTFFQSLLMSSLLYPKFYAEIDTLQDLFETNLKVYVPIFSGKVITKGLKLEDLELINHLVSIPQSVTMLGLTTEWLDDYMYQKSTGFIAYKSQLAFMKSKMDFDSNWHVMPKTILPYIRGYYCRRNKLYYPEVVDLFGLLNQAGIFMYQNVHNYGILSNTSKEKTMNDESKHERGEVSLTISHLEIAFMLLIVGYLCGAIGFIVERIIFHTCKKESVKMFDYRN